MSDKYLRDEKQQLLNAIGTEQDWGWSPAVDFRSLLEGRLPDGAKRAAPQKSTHNDPTLAVNTENPNGTTKSKDELEFEALLQGLPGASASSKNEEEQSGDHVNILIAGAGDIRHIFRTISQLRLEEEKKAKQGDGAAEGERKTYHFYIYEPNLRIHCRHLFFLQWLLDSMFSLEDLEERVLMFLDVYGNAMIREITAAQCRNVVQRLLRALQSEDGELMRMTSFTEMKMKERDFIESQLLHWGRDASHADIAEQWENRLRQEMAERFDNRNNIIDWDFVFRLTDYTNLLKFPEYRDWRNTGIAFDVGHINPRRGFDYHYNTPNKSLCHFDRRGRGAYCGDVKNGPFFGFGAQSENKQIRQRTADGTCKYGNGVVSMHNIRAWLYTLMTGMEWPWSDHKFAWDDDKHYNYLPPGTPSGTEFQVRFPPVKFHFVGLELSRLLLHVKEGKVPPFDAGFVGTAVIHELTPELFQAFEPHAVVVAETAKFIVDAEEEAKDAFTERILGAARAAQWKNNVQLTAALHKGQPEPRKEDGTASKAQQLSLKRYAKPYQIALTMYAVDVQVTSFLLQLLLLLSHSIIITIITTFHIPLLLCYMEDCDGDNKDTLLCLISCVGLAVIVLSMRIKKGLGVSPLTTIKKAVRCVHRGESIALDKPHRVEMYSAAGPPTPHFADGTFHYSSPEGSSHIDWFTRANALPYTPSESRSPDVSREVVEMDGTDTSALQLEDLVSALRRVTNGIRKGEPESTGERRGLEHTLGPKQSPPPQPYPRAGGDVSFHTDPEGILSMVEGPPGGRSPNYSSRMMQTLSCIEGMGLHQTPPTAELHPVNQADSQPRDLHEEGKMWRLQKRRWIALEKERQALLEQTAMLEACSFKPKISPYAERLSRPASLRPEHRAQEEMLRRRQWEAVKKKEKAESEMKGCTFTPATLHSASARSKKERKGGVVFEHLFADAEDRHHFFNEVKASVVQEVEQYATGFGEPSPAVPPKKIEKIVERLFARGTTIDPAQVLEQPSHSPELEAAPWRALRKEGEGNRCSFCGSGPTAAEREQQQEVALTLEAAARAEAAEKAKKKREAMRVRLERERLVGILCEKFRALARHISREQKVVYRPSAPQPLAAVTRAAETLLRVEESAGIAAALTDFESDVIHEKQFARTLAHYLEREAPHDLTRCSHPLLQPLAADGARSRSPSAPQPQQPPHGELRVRREKVDPAVIAAAREKREKFLRDLEAESNRRRNGDGPVKFEPRLIPYACRPDVQPVIKKTRSVALRQAYIQQQLEAKAKKSLGRFLSPDALDPVTRALFPDDETKGRASPSPVASAPSSAGNHLHAHPHHQPGLAVDERYGLSHPVSYGRSAEHQESLTDIPFSLRRSSPLKPQSLCEALRHSVGKISQSRSHAENVSCATDDELEALEYGRELLIQQLRDVVLSIDLCVFLSYSVYNADRSQDLRIYPRLWLIEATFFFFFFRFRTPEGSQGVLIFSKKKNTNLFHSVVQPVKTVGLASETSKMSRFPNIGNNSSRNPSPRDDDDLDARACAGYIAKLKSVLDSATGDPPPGVEVGEVEHRIMLLQGALDEVKIKNLELSKERELQEQQRYLKAVQRLLEQEEKLQSQQAKDTKAKILAVQQAKEEAVLYFKDKNEKKAERMQKCREHNVKVEEETVLKGSAVEERRQRNLENLYAEREQKRKEMMERARKREEYARNVKQNRVKQEEERRREMEERTRLQEQEIAAKLELLRNARKSVAVEKGQHSRAKSVVVWENGEAIIETEMKDHDQLVKELAEKEKAQRERYLGEKADRDFYISQQQQLREEREKKIAGNLLKLANTRLKRGEEIKAETFKKYDKADNAQIRAAEKQHQAGEALRKNLAQHQHRSMELEQERQNTALAKTFQRWNFRAARIISELRTAMEEKKPPQDDNDDPWQNTSNRNTQPEPEKRPPLKRKGKLAYDGRYFWWANRRFSRIEGPADSAVHSFIRVRGVCCHSSAACSRPTHSRTTVRMREQPFSSALIMRRQTVGYRAASQNERDDSSRGEGNEIIKIEAR
eukprot:gene8744-6149_t